MPAATLSSSYGKVRRATRPVCPYPGRSAGFPARLLGEDARRLLERIELTAERESELALGSQPVRCGKVPGRTFGVDLQGEKPATGHFSDNVNTEQRNLREGGVDALTEPDNVLVVLKAIVHPRPLLTIESPGARSNASGSGSGGRVWSATVLWHDNTCPNNVATDSSSAMARYR